MYECVYACLFVYACVCVRVRICACVCLCDLPFAYWKLYLCTLPFVFVTLQVVWAESSEVGCGVAYCPKVYSYAEGSEEAYLSAENAVFVVCDYRPGYVVVIGTI